jgi:hypothetical protein
MERCGVCSRGRASTFAWELARDWRENVNIDSCDYDGGVVTLSLYNYAVEAWRPKVQRGYAGDNRFEDVIIPMIFKECVEEVDVQGGVSS